MKKKHKKIHLSDTIIAISIILFLILLGIIITYSGRNKTNFNNFLINPTYISNKVENSLKKEISNNINDSISYTFKGTHFKIIVNDVNDNKYQVVIYLDENRFLSEYECCLVAENIIKNLLYYHLDTYEKFSSLQFVFYSNNKISYQIKVNDITNVDISYIQSNLLLYSSNNKIINYNYSTEYNKNGGISIYEKEKEEEYKQYMENLNAKQEEEHKQYIEEQQNEGAKNLKQIRKDYKDNALVASDKYKGKTYTLCGQFNAVNEDSIMNKILDMIGVTITFKDGNSIVYVFCYFNSDQRDKLLKYKKGDTILFSGICNDWGCWNDCKIIE